MPVQPKMPRITTIVIIFVLLLPPLLENLYLLWNAALIFVLVLVAILPFFGAACNIFLLRRIFIERRKITSIMMEISFEVRASTRRSDGEFNRVLKTIQDLHTNMQDSQETLTREVLTQRH